jgi:HKD family nuclease
MSTFFTPATSVPSTGRIISIDLTMPYLLHSTLMSSRMSANEKIKKLIWTKIKQAHTIILIVVFKLVDGDYVREAQDLSGRAGA